MQQRWLKIPYYYLSIKVIILNAVHWFEIHRKAFPSIHVSSLKLLQKHWIFDCVFKWSFLPSSRSSVLQAEPKAKAETSRLKLLLEASSGVDGFRRRRLSCYSWEDDVFASDLRLRVSTKQLLCSVVGKRGCHFEFSKLSFFLFVW